MNKLCKQYISEIRCFFSAYGKEEKKYLQKLAQNIDDFIEEENVTNIEELHDNFGNPHDVANTYFANIDTAEYIQRTRINKWIKYGIVTLISIALIGVSCYTVYKYHYYKILEQNSIFFEEIEFID